MPFIMAERFDRDMPAPGALRVSGPDCLLSGEFFAAQRSSSIEPYKRLKLGVLEDAVYVIQGKAKRSEHDSKTAHLVFETTIWFLAEEPSRWPFTFLNICDVFDLKAATIIESLGLKRSPELEAYDKMAGTVFRTGDRGGRPRVIR